MKKSILFTCLFLLSNFVLSAYDNRGQINWLTNYEEALRQGAATSKPIILFFTGSDWCSWCIKLEEESLNTPEFADLAGKEFVFLKLDYPLNRRPPPEIVIQNKKLKKEFDIQGYPTIVMIDGEKQQIIGRTPYRAGGGRQFALFLLNMRDQHKPYQQKIDNLGKQSFSGAELRELYDQATQLKREQDANHIAATGLDSDQRHFFLLERYRLLSEQGQNNSEAALAIRQQLLASDPSNRKLTHYQVAVIDFDASCRNAKDSPQATVAALTDYIEKFGDKDKDNIWRLQMLISQVYFEKNQLAEALKYAQSSYSSAPKEVQPEIITAIHNIETQLTPSP